MRVLCAAAAFLLIAVVGFGCATEDETATGESEIGTRPPKRWTPSAKKSGNLRIATYNIRNFPKDMMGQPDGGADAGTPAEEATVDPAALVRRQTDTDLAMAVELLDKLDFDVLAVQEINDPRAFEDLIGRLGNKNGHRYQAAFSTDWPHVQHTGIVVRADRARIESPRVHAEVATRPTMRAGFSARIVSTKEPSAGEPRGADFGLLVVHLASGDSGGRARLRAEQASFAAKAIADLKNESGDDDVIVVGDFNTAGQEEEMPAFDSAITGSESGLSRQKNESACTTYYTKGKEPLLVPSWIDHVYTSSLAERDLTVPIVSGAHCAERSCQPFESSGPESGTSYWGVSDHCPVYFEIVDQDRD
jgi:endonuclease/exonuclease/phosphatase family metal-dependent hydrolase